MHTHEQFSPEERALLAPYVTNTDRSIFVLTQLPEVIKGALFSRYSRSTLGLRQLLLKEFIQNHESAFQEIQGRSPEFTPGVEVSRLALGKAQDFYDRILDGYGDDSIGELGGAHLAVENISILATKVLEDARLGGSPLEKSTRYVTFNKKVNGDYLFYREPRLLDSAHRERYLEINRHLFETYSRLIEPMTAHVQKLMPREAEVNEAAYQRSVKAKMFDLIRGLLPAATLTNMGIYGNGRFFETLISKLHLSPLQELRTIANVSYQELAQVIPSFIRRAHPEHRHFQGFQQFQYSSQQALESFLKAQGLPSVAEGASLVSLVEYDPNAEASLLAALIYPQVALTWEQVKTWVKTLSEAEINHLWQAMLEPRQNRRHKLGRAWEMVYYTFDVLGDYGMYRDLQRHRVLTQERQPLSTRFGYETPPEIEDAGLGADYHEAMQRAAEAYETIALDFPHEAQYVVPLAYRIRWFLKINLRALTWLVELRSTPQGHEGYRLVAQEMYRRVQEVQPRLAQSMKFVDLERYPLGRLHAEIKHEAKFNTNSQ